MGPFGNQFVDGIASEPDQNFLAGRPKSDDHLPAVATVTPPLDHPTCSEAIHQLNHGMMPELESFREGANRRRLPTLEALHLQQQQILLRLDASCAGCGLADTQESANVIPQVREGRIVQAGVNSRGSPSAECHREPVYHLTIRSCHLVIYSSR
jgi:hypothetical protein